jgi:hypothetical protein
MIGQIGVAVPRHQGRLAIGAFKRHGDITVTIRGGEDNYGRFHGFSTPSSVLQAT